MLNYNILLQKNGISEKANSVKLMMELSGIKNKVSKNIKRKPLNISFCIDTSGSMSGYLSYNNNTSITDQLLNLNTSGTVRKSKIDLAKESLLTALDLMHDGDIVSVVKFNQEGVVVVPSSVLNQHTRKEIKTKVLGINSCGCTDMNQGWSLSAAEVSKSLSRKFINRVVVISDGMTMNAKKVVENVNKLAKSFITTSTFGIGSDFDEDLLLEISNSGEGNAYYIENNKQAISHFENEFSGLSNVCANSVSVEFIPSQSSRSIKSKNELSFVDENAFKFKVKDVIFGKTLKLIFDIDLNKDFTKNLNIDIGKFIISYIDQDGKNRSTEVAVSSSVFTEDEYENLPFNEEVMVTDTLLTVAYEQDKSKKALDNNDSQGVEDILNKLRNMLQNSKYAHDNRISSALRSTENMLSRGSLSGFVGNTECRKEMSYFSATARTQYY